MNEKLDQISVILFSPNKISILASANYDSSCLNDRECSCYLCIPHYFQNLPVAEGHIVRQAFPEIEHCSPS